MRRLSSRGGTWFGQFQFSNHEAMGRQTIKPAEKDDSPPIGRTVIASSLGFPSRASVHQIPAESTTTSTWCSSMIEHHF